MSFLNDILNEGMIVVSNTYIPTKKKKLSGEDKRHQPIATTEAGDVAFFKPHAVRREKSKLSKKMKELEKLRGKKRKAELTVDDLLKKMKEDESSEEEEDDEEESSEEESSDDSGDELEDEMYSLSRGVKSITGADWRPNFIDRMTMFIAGVPGAGKSYLAKEMIKLLPDNLPILLFTALEETDGNFTDKGIAESRLHKIRMTYDNLSKISLKEIRERAGSKQVILLFDDIDKIRDAKVRDATYAIMNDALANGRGHEKHDGTGDIHVLITSHALNDYQKTKFPFENSNYVALFPGKTPPLQLQRMFLKLGLDKELCMKMIKLGRSEKIRSIIIHKVIHDRPGSTYDPMYLIYGDRIMLL